MIGNVIQYILYFQLFVTVVAGVGGLLMASLSRNGAYTKTLLTYLAVLSLIAGTAPYIGLFGTVWHIIQALGGIGNGNLNVAAIAQPIGEALYATLWGLGAAIPALVFHRAIIMVAPEDTEVATPEAVATQPVEGS